MSVFFLPIFHDEAAAIEKLESIIWPNGPVCPKCGVMGRSGKLGGKSTRMGTRKCYACRKKFTCTVGTVFEDSHVPMTYWMQAVYLMASSKKGFSSHQVMRALDVQYKTAWFMTHRIREAMRDNSDPRINPMGGAGSTIEGDETYVGGKAANRAFGPIPTKHPVVSLVERGGKVRSFHVPNVTANNLYPIIARQTHKDSRFMTDENNVYAAIGRTFTGGYETVNHSAKEYVRDDAYTNTVEGFFSILKRGIFRHLSARERSPSASLPCRIRLPLLLPDQDRLQ